MIALDEDALICDFAETYNIYDYRSLSVDYASTLAYGLRNDSRIKLKAIGLEEKLSTLLLAHICDNTAYNVYAKTKDAKRGTNKPKSFVEMLFKNKEKELRGFDDGEEFMKEWRKINGN